jgi:hypothetical protein
MVFRVSVKSSEFRFDPDGPAQRARERPAGAGPFEALEPPARVDAAARLLYAGHEHAFAFDEAHELGLRGLAAAARARPHRL